MNNCVIFCDFDGTITAQDTIDSLLQKYGDPEWLEIEKLWEEGSIGSRECLERQIACVKGFSESKLDEFVNSMEIDSFFKDFVDEARSQGIPVYIVSDGFDLFINKILEKNGINDLEVFSNKLVLRNDELIPLFPNKNINCESKSGTCKCSIIKNISNGREIIYVGDGRSDMCASKHVDLLFAKGKLAEYCREKGMNHTEICNFSKVIEELVVRKEESVDKYRIAIG